ncbi:Bhp2, hydrophobin class II [Amylocarpus encephaloides]|uniref:Bhp2, hydrophobin class II n=1 Tax=Amylocarpus encephaloides TaxID=45428 RepID=A0A9P8C548_9HELO|nr:Bhp2, hydrophobin class II [Amylocarpus encephaloides]
MQFTLITITSLMATALAIPSQLASNHQARQVGLCASGTPQCCDVNVLGVADLNCETPPTLPTTIPDFNDICAGIGKINMCCLLPILDQALLCASPDNSS